MDEFGIVSGAIPRTSIALLRKISFRIFSDRKRPFGLLHRSGGNEEQKMSDRRELYRGPNGDA
jgi:hypothetical protein